MKTTVRKITNAALLLCALMITGTTFAQRGGQGGGQQGPPPMPSDDEIVEMVSDLADEISLDEGQEAEILELYQAHFEEMESKMESGRPDRDEMEALMSDFEEDVNAVLTDEQQKLYKKYLKNNRPQGRN
ncbi:hypothetical protein [Maribacter polysaccharolyticus]|uniref:hypothetical protein n=1 Tax=Maribacter polysaccharolyticus TaxID=3020831 RepID=UPI00237FD633|nr:hypothetical protein [Maribacter polysaccharolyticus]MDE3742015.1 hypothetical protein [Maribacter polysaccharolyticus]